MIRLRAVVVLLTFFVGLLTVVIAFVVAKVNHIYVGGLTWPFISDLGRDPPGSYVFFFGLNFTAVLLGVAWIFNHEYQHIFLQKSYDDGQITNTIRSLSYVSCLFGVIGAIGLPLFASFDSSPVVHRNAAFAFLLCEAVAMVINTFLNYQIFVIKRNEMDVGVFITDRYGPRSVSRIKIEELNAVKRGFIIELACVALFFMSVIVYLPVLYKNAPAKHLTIEECLEKQLGTNYCETTMRLDDINTKLWNYEHDYAVHQVRALAQLGCIATLWIYILSFVANNKEQEAAKEQDRIAITTRYYQNQAGFVGGSAGGVRHGSPGRRSRRPHKQSRSQPSSPPSSIASATSTTPSQWTSPERRSRPPGYIPV